jgi:hypothetical protein
VKETKSIETDIDQERARRQRQVSTKRERERDVVGESSREKVVLAAFRARRTEVRVVMAECGGWIPINTRADEKERRW